MQFYWFKILKVISVEDEKKYMLKIIKWKIIKFNSMCKIINFIKIKFLLKFIKFHVLKFRKLYVLKMVPDSGKLSCVW